MKRALLLLIGLSAAIALVVWQGAEDVLRALGAGGWGLLWLLPYAVLPLVLDALAWGPLLPGRGLVFGRLFAFAWIGAAVNTLLPVATVGGEVVKARLAALEGVPAPDAGASVVADKTIQAATIVLYGLVGILLWVALAGGDAAAVPVLAASLTLMAGVAGFYWVQQRGLFGGAARVARRLAPARAFAELGGGAEALDAALEATYCRRGRLLRALLARSLYRVAMTGELYLILYLLDQPLGLVEVVILHSLGLAVRAAAFVVPGALGVQEGGYVVLGAALGLTPEVALSASLARRLRELVVNVPGLIGWQVLEARAWRAAS